MIDNCVGKIQERKMAWNGNCRSGVFVWYC